MGRKKKRLKEKEFLSGIKKEQKYTPVIRLTVYWNQKEPWDGEKKIQNLIKLENVPEQLQKKIPNYEMNLLEIRDIEDIEVFRTDLRLVLGFLKRMENKKELETFIQNNKEEFCFMPEDTYDMIWVLAGERKLKRLKQKIMNEKERCDMCKALEDIREESRKRGEDDGKKVGLEIGKKTGLEIAMKLTKLLIEDGRVEDLKKATENKKYQTRLLKEYQLI
ncbi:MAG: Rpn family recombination-promoting nuclease/putative transposase [Oliverpabstia sp.]